MFSVIFSDYPLGNMLFFNALMLLASILQPAYQNKKAKGSRYTR